MMKITSLTSHGDSLYALDEEGSVYYLNKGTYGKWKKLDKIFTEEDQKKSDQRFDDLCRYPFEIRRFPPETI